MFLKGKKETLSAMETEASLNTYNKENLIRRPGCQLMKSLRNQTGGRISKSREPLVT